MIDESILEGFTKLTDTVRRAVGIGIKDPFDLGVYAHIKMEANWSTGIYHGTALTIAYRFGNLTLYPKIKRSMLRLRKSRLINYQVTAGRHGAYDVLVEGFQVTLGGLKGQYLNAWAHSHLALPEYEDAARERPEDGLKTARERPEDGHYQDDQEVLDVCRWDQAEQSLARHDSSTAPLRGEDNIPHRGPQDKDKHNSKDSGSVPNPPIGDFADRDWNQEAEYAFNSWRVVYGNFYDLEDFLLLQEFDSKVKATLQGHGTLRLVIQWAKWICNDDKIRTLENSTQFREEFSRNILPKFTNYTNKTTPLVFAERCKQLYLDNDGPTRLAEIEWDEVKNRLVEIDSDEAENRPHRHKEADCLEEELMFAAEDDENETTLFYPWEDEGIENEMTLLNPWED